MSYVAPYPNRLGDFDFGHLHLTPDLGIRTCPPRDPPPKYFPSGNAIADTVFAFEGWNSLLRLQSRASAVNRTACSSPIVLGLLLIILLSACGGAAAEPPSAADEPAQVESTQPQPAATFIPAPSPTSEFLIPDTGGGEEDFPAAAPAIPEQRLLSLEFPPRIRAGDSDIVRLTLEVDESGDLTPTAEVEGNVVTGEMIEIPNLYETHHVIVEARFDLAGMQVSPPDLVSQTLSPGQTVRFYWSIRPDEPGVYRGTVWLYLRFADKVSGEESQQAVSAQIVEIEAMNFFGIPANMVRVAGGFGSVVGAVVGFPFFEDIVRFLFSRRRRRVK